MNIINHHLLADLWSGPRRTPPTHLIERSLFVIAATVLTIIGSAAIYCFIVIVVIQVNLVILGQCTIIIIPMV